MEQHEKLGERLRLLRKKKGISLEEIEAKTKISKAYVIALEEERFDRLPEPVLVRGFLRQITHALGDDPEEVVTLYDQELIRRTPPKPIPKKRKKSSFVPMIVLSLFLVLGLSTGYKWFFHHTPVQRRVAPPISKPIPSPIKKQEHILQLLLTSPCWLQVKEGEKVVYQGLLQKDASFQQSFPQELSLLLGDPQGVTLKVDGKTFPFLFEPRKPLRLKVTPQGVSYE